MGAPIPSCMNQASNKLIIIAGPTAVGKTALAVSLAQQLHTEVVSCDSRQFYRELRIGVARPTPHELAAAPHHFIACRSVTEPYNIYDYSVDALATINALFATGHDTVVACGGSGLYIDALLRTPARLPDPSAELRSRLQQMPLADKQALLNSLDPVSYTRIDTHNPVRLQRALEVCLTTGRPYSTVLASQQQPTPRPFDIEVRVLDMPSDELRRRIDIRVDQMIAYGLLDEVSSLLPYRHLNTLNTVGYRELFPVIDGTTTLSNAIEQIKLNTWHYARRQITWMHRYTATA